MQSIDQLESKTIGGEWLVKQAFDNFGLSDLFSSIGMSDKESGIAQMLLTAKMVHPSSELETERWLQENSGVDILYNSEDHHKVSRYRLYKVASILYKNKDKIEQKMYTTTNNLFSQKSKIVIYDLTNMYFEGQMLGSEKAKFGRSKQKRNDRRLIGLALAIDSMGFVRYSKIYKGNVGEPETFETMLDDVASQLYTSKEKSIIVMDAGISTEENLGYIRQFSKVSKLYNVSYKEDVEKGIVTDITWELQKEKESPKGEYFLRYSKDKLSEEEIWNTYNMTRDVEATFRCLKTDLDIRPFFHQKDAYIEPHIWLGIVAYQIVNYIKLKLKESEINYSWSTIVRKMQSQQYSVQSANRKQGGKIYTSLCTKPSSDLKKIYEALNFKEHPFVRKSKVVTQQ